MHSHLPHMEFYGWLSTIFENKKIRFFISKHVANDFFGGSKLLINQYLQCLYAKFFHLRQQR